MSVYGTAGSMFDFLYTDICFRIHDDDGTVIGYVAIDRGLEKEHMIEEIAEKHQSGVIS